VNLQRFHPAENRQDFMQIREALGIARGELMVTTMGAVMPRKGSDLLLETWNRVLKSMPGVHLVFVGPRKDLQDPGLGDYRARLEQLIGDSGATGQVYFTGLVDNVESYLHASDVFVLPSHREGMPNCVLEAMACGVPVIITPFFGLSDDLGKPGEHYLLADFSPDSLAEELRRLLRDPGLRQRLADTALQWIRQTMDQQASLDQYASLYKELASKQKAVAFASFDSLSRKEADGFFKSDKLKPSDASDGDSYKVRLGKLGGYRDYFSDEQNACIDSLVWDRLNPVYGYR
jgi:glycosyltransferase involved in cell wall biosynthesis